MPHFLWFLGHTKTDSTPQHIRWPLQYLFNTHMISNTCPSSHTWYLLWYDKEQGRGEKIGKSLFSHVVLAHSEGLGATPVYPWSSLWYGWGSLCNWIYCQRVKQYRASRRGVLFYSFFVGHRVPKKQVAEGAFTQPSQSRHCETLLFPTLALKWATHCMNSNDLLTGFSLCSCSEMC